MFGVFQKKIECFENFEFFKYLEEEEKIKYLEIFEHFESGISKISNPCNFVSFWSWINFWYLDLCTPRDLSISGVFQVGGDDQGDPKSRYTNRQNLDFQKISDQKPNLFT